MATRKKSDSSNLAFESALAKLESIVVQLENEDTSLADALTAFEEAVALTRETQTVLAAAEQRVRVLLEKNGEPVEGEAPGGEGPE